MNIGKLKEQLLASENKRWVRIVEGFFTLLPAWTSMLMLVEINTPADIHLLKYAYWGSILSCPFIAFLMYRNSDLRKIERLAILVTMLSASFAILVAAIETQTI